MVRVRGGFRQVSVDMIADDLERWERVCRRSGIVLRYRNIPRPIWFHIPPAPILIFMPCWPVRPYQSWMLRGVLAVIVYEALGEDRIVWSLLGLLGDVAPHVEAAD